MTAKEITLNYLKNIKRDLEYAITKSKEIGINPIVLKMDQRAISTAIGIVKGSEGE